MSGGVGGAARGDAGGAPGDASGDASGDAGGGTAGGAGSGAGGPGGLRRVVVLAGGYGGAKLSHGLALASAARATAGRPSLDLTVVVNTGDDLDLHGLAVSPDLDTVMYTLSGWANESTGWGVRDETWSGKEMLERYGASVWFGLGDRDLATHLVRTQGLRAGERLTAVTARLASSLGVPATLLPMSDDPVRTELLVDGAWIAFQEYFVHRHHAVDVTAVRHAGVSVAQPTAEVLAAIAAAELVVAAPSNPFVSIGTILALPGMRDALLAALAPVVAVSPIVGGAALRGPADRMLQTIGDGEASAAGFVRHYRTHHPGLVDAFVIDERDAELAATISEGGAEPVLLTDTVMTDHAARERLGAAILERFLPPA
jgi:LPPG:FO 2-phospho-L-lactate transferase